MSEVDVISFNYNLSDIKGNFIESPEEPTSIIQGKEQVLKPVEEAIAGLNPGESARIEVNHQKAYGVFNESLVVQVPKTKFKGTPQVGSRFKVKVEGSSVEMTVADHKDGFFILDGNHPLAGIDLVFDLKVTQRRAATENEIQTGSIQVTN